MNCTQLQELAAAYALGALDRPDAARLEALAGSDPDIGAEVDAFLCLAARLLGAVTAVAPPARLRESVLSRIRATPQQRRPVSSIPPELAPAELAGFQFLRLDESAWVGSGVPGLRVQTLAANVRNNYAMLYLELAAGTVYPQHEHSGDEELFVVSGDLVTEGKTLKAGDFLHSESGTVHHELFSPNGCRAILVTPLTSAIGEAARLHLRQVGRKVRSKLGLGGGGSSS